ncbi:anti-sigma factor family protein [Castellaniella ginsengisoli]
MPCPRTVLLSACLDPEWTGRGRALIQAHVAVCPVCAAELETLGAMTAALRALPDPAGAPDLSRAWQPAAAGRRVMVRPFREAMRAWLGWVPAGLAVTASLAAGIGLASWSWPAASPVPSLAAMARFDAFGPVPPGGLCAARLCETLKEKT